MMNLIQLLSPLFFFFFPLSFFISELAAAQNTTIPFNVGIILDFDTTVGKMGMSCIAMALDDFYATHSFYKTRLVLHTRDSKKDTVRAASMALDLLKNIEVQAIIGPQTSAQANFVVDLGDKAQVPIVSFSATSLLPLPQTPYLIRALQSDASHVKAITAIVQSFGWREAIPIYEDTDYGNGIIPHLINAFGEIDTHVPYQSAITPLATDDQIFTEIYKLMTMQSRVFILHMSPSLGSRFFMKAKEAGMMSQGYAWIITDGLANFLNSMDPYVIYSMQGVLGVRPYVPKSKELDDFKVKWRKKFEQEYADGERPDLNILGLRAYDIVWALAMAAEKVGGEESHYHQLEAYENSTDLATLGVSQIGPTLLQTILKTQFKGLSGEFRLLDGQLQTSVFEVINVIGNEGREIGFWTPTNGIVRELNSSSTRTYSTSKANLGAIIWPGESTTVPKGWVIATSGKKMRIGVPEKDGFNEFVKVSRDPTTNETIVTGYCIDVFKTVIEALPFAVPYEFIPFGNADTISSGDYNELVSQVYFHKFDAAVGDITILANRSLYVDFAARYTEVGVSMIVPIKEDKRMNTWIFLKPLTRELWLATGAAFIFTGIVVWVLEHRVNTEFSGTPSQQIGTTLWFSFSTIAFAQREKVVHNLSRLVVIVWIFVVLILTQCYTASLTSMLTVQQLTVKEVKELIINEEFVGYQRGSFVRGILKHLHFDESRLVPLASLEEYDDALSKGSRNGGVAAIFDEIPYIKAFLAKYCDKYAMVGPTYNTDGFGFIFQKGSPLVLEFSRVISKAIEEDTFASIEKRLFPNQVICGNSDSPSVNSLTLDGFKGLFLITIVTSAFALFVFLVQNLKDHRQALIIAFKNRSSVPILRRLAKWLKQKWLTLKTKAKRGESSTDASRSTLNHSIVEICPREEASSWSATSEITPISS